MTVHSPFLVCPDFISPKTCESLISAVEIKAPDLDSKGNPMKMERSFADGDSIIYEPFKKLIPEIEERYGATYVGLNQPTFIYYPENPKAPGEQAGCESAKYIRRKWVKYKDVDLVGMLWLKDFNSNVPLDPRIEVFGGKLEFPAYNFSFVPQRGTLVVYPAGPHFITAVSSLLVGDLYVVKLNICITTKDKSMWFYQPDRFPGKWTDWLDEHL